MSLNFLGKKSFHPANPQNVRKLVMAEEKKKAEEKKAAELKREYEEQEARRHARSLLGGGSSSSGGAISTSFMYQAPPGLREAEERRQKDLKQQQQQQQQQTAQQAQHSEHPQQTRADRDAERFPILKHAPREGAYTNDLEVHHKPFGVALRNVKCSRCGEWGHQTGDRECPMRHATTKVDEAAKVRDDPLQKASSEGGAAADVLRWVPKRAPEVGLHGGASADDANQQFVPMLDDTEQQAVAATAASAEAAMRHGASREVAGMDDLDPAVLSMLTEKQQRRLLKMYQKELAAEADGGPSERSSSDGHRPEKRRRHHGSGHRDHRGDEDNRRRDRKRSHSHHKRGHGRDRPHGSRHGSRSSNSD